MYKGTMYNVQYTFISQKHCKFKSSRFKYYSS